MIIEKLRARTKANHEALEKAMFPFMQNIKTTDDYAKLLRLFYGYYKPLQTATDQFLNDNTLLDYASLRKAEWILADLEALVLSAESIPLCALPFKIDSQAAAIGALYVTEGSTLGGKIICKMIANKLNIDNLEGLRFFNGYGDKTGSHWKNVLAVLDTYSNSPDENTILESADDVFKGFAQWIEQQPTH